MGFHKRFLSEETIRSNAKSDFQSFETYMTNADAYIVNTGWADKIYHQFGQSKEKQRKELHKQIQNGTI
jgi:ATP-dependent phosphoenolpyruvate carboxykinase